MTAELATMRRGKGASGSSRAAVAAAAAQPSAAHSTVVLEQSAVSLEESDTDEDDDSDARGDDSESGDEDEVEEAGFISWIKMEWGDSIAFLDSSVMILVVIIDLAVYPTIFASYFSDMISIEESLGYWQLYAASAFVIALGTALTLAGVRTVGSASQVLQLGVLLPLVCFVLVGFSVPTLDTSVWLRTSTEGREWRVGDYVSVIVWSMCSFEYSAFLAKDLRNSRRQFPLVLIAAIVLMLLTYLLPILVLQANWQKPSTASIVEGAVSGNLFKLKKKTNTLFVFYLYFA